MTEAERLAVSEVTANFAEKLLSDGAFIRQVVADNRTFGKRILNKLRALLDRLNGRRNLSEEEKHLKDVVRTLESEFNEALKQAEEQWVMRQKSLDSDGKIRYSGKTWFSFIHKNFPTYHESGGSEANNLAIWWAKRKDTRTGDETLISMNDRWYVVKKFDDAINNYQVEERITEKEFDKINKEIEIYGRSGKIKSITKSTDGIDKFDKRSYPINERKSSIDSNETRHRREDSSFQRLDKGTSQRGRIGGNGSGNRQSSSTNQRRYSIKIDGETVQGSLEESNNLVALHNLSEDKLSRVIDLGGFPMPSIAITTTDLPHDNYGDITVVFDKNTIDPEADERNVVYDRDAWTRTRRQGLWHRKRNYFCKG